MLTQINQKDVREIENLMSLLGIASAPRLLPDKISLPFFQNEKRSFKERWLIFRGFTPSELKKKSNSQLLWIIRHDWEAHGNYPGVNTFVSWDASEVTADFARSWVYSAAGIYIESKEYTNEQINKYIKRFRKFKRRNKFWRKHANKIRALKSTLNLLIAEISAVVPILSSIDTLYVVEKRSSRSVLSKKENNESEKMKFLKNEYLSSLVELLVPIIIKALNKILFRILKKKLGQWFQQH